MRLRECRGVLQQRELGYAVGKRVLTCAIVLQRDGMSEREGNAESSCSRERELWDSDGKR